MEEQKDVPEMFYFYNGIPLHKVLSPPGHVDKLSSIEFKKGDVMLVGYPKSGTHWMQQIIWLIQHKGDTAFQKDVYINQRVKMLDLVNGKGGSVLDALDETSHPWLVKTHMPATIFDRQIRERKCKIIIIMRNPKDILVSTSHFYRSFNVTNAKDMSSYFEYFKRSVAAYGDWLSHALSWWQHQHLQNVHVIKFEDIKSDPGAAIRDLAQFMEVDLTDDQVKVIVEETAFTTLKKNQSVNHVEAPGFDSNISPLLRKGEVGDWKKEFTQDMSDYVEEYFMQPAGQYGLKFSDDC